MQNSLLSLAVERTHAFLAAVIAMQVLARSAAALAPTAAVIVVQALAPTAALGAESADAKPVPPPYKTAGKLSHAVQKYSGLNFVTDRVASAAASTALSTYLHGRVHVKVRGYNFSDALQGEVQNVDITIKRGKWHGIPIGSLHARSTTPFKFNYLPFSNHKIGLVTPVMVALDGQLSEKLVSKALKSKAVTDNLRFLKLDLPGLGEQRLQVLDPEVDVNGDRISVKANLITAGAAPETGVTLTVAARPVIDKERYVILKDIEVQSDAIQNQVAFASFVELLLNPLIDFARMDRATHAFRVTDLSVKDQRVNFAGRLLLAPKPQTPQQPTQPAQQPQPAGIAKGGS